MRKPTLHDVARTAGVSYATADRVLNARGGVAEKSMLRVQRAIDALGYERDLHAANLSRRRTYAFQVFLPQGDHSFFTVLRCAVEQERLRRMVDRVEVTIREVPAMDADRLAEALEAVAPGACDCVAVVAADTPRVAAAIARLSRAGIPVITLIADAAPDHRAAYVGIDNLVAGRTAGRLIRLAHYGRSGCILPILGLLTASDHRDRLKGARDVLQGHAAQPDFRILPAIEVYDRSDRMRDAVEQLLQGGTEVSGIYSIGAGNRALIQILRRLGPARPFTVMHDLTDHTRRALEEGVIDAIIDQKPAQEVAVALDVMKAIADRKEFNLAALAISPSIILQDNIPALVSDS